MELQNQPMKQVENKFVITEDRAYFLLRQDRAKAPQFIEILGEIFNLDDPEVSQELEKKLSERKIILGYYDPSTEEIEVHLPLEPNDYVENRIKVVFGNEAI